jgi:hypothetical protein
VTAPDIKEMLEVLGELDGAEAHLVLTFGLAAAKLVAVMDLRSKLPPPAVVVWRDYEIVLVPRRAP